MSLESIDSAGNLIAIIAEFLSKSWATYFISDDPDIPHNLAPFNEILIETYGTAEVVLRKVATSLLLKNNATTALTETKIYHCMWSNPYIRFDPFSLLRLCFKQADHSDRGKV